MAEVLSPPMQPPSTITMLHSRPSSADAFQPSQQYHQPPRLNQAPRSMYTGHNGGYRTSSAPVQPYAFQSTPTPHLRQDSRSTSTPNLVNGHFSNHRSTASASTSSSEASLQMQTKDESSNAPRLAPTVDFSPQLPELSFTSFEPAAKASPDRYRRPAHQRIDSSPNTSTARTISPAVGDASLENAPHTGLPPQIQRQTSLDDIPTSKAASSKLADRYRRRSLQQLENVAGANTTASQASADATQPLQTPPINAISKTPAERPGSSTDSAGESRPSLNSNRPSSKKENDAPSESTKSVIVSGSQEFTPPPRGSSATAKRVAAPSPLSRQATDVDSLRPSTPESPPKRRTYAAVAAQSAVPSLSPAAAQLAAVSDKDLNKGMKSRLRRAFSFGSAQELRRAAGENSLQTTQLAREQHQQHIDDELDAEQLEIARRQEAAGIGAGIYSGQGGFTGSTDNLSISSTASSASLMLRKMGRGAKKGARSIKGLFRPKSVIGVPAADGPIQIGASSPVEPSIGQVSMVTVEAERQNVNVNIHPDERTGGGTGFPKLERNSLDAAAAAAAGAEARGSAETSDSHSRRSIVGSDKDRAEVLAAVRKGILKRSGSGSPSGSPIVSPNQGAGLPNVSHITESPTSSLPGTPRDGPPGRSASAPAVNDYFARGMHMAKSMPNTPNGSVRSISFSPRIQFHDAWSSSDYDRRGEIATCNRLTPLLAQQIKEELNTFKMEMEVHELSKPHTHFF